MSVATPSSFFLRVAEKEKERKNQRGFRFSPITSQVGFLRRQVFCFTAELKFGELDVFYVCIVTFIGSDAALRPLTKWRPLLFLKFVKKINHYTFNMRCYLF